MKINYSHLKKEFSVIQNQTKNQQNTQANKQKNYIIFLLKENLNLSTNR
jgi:hypothetical protein